MIMLMIINSMVILSMMFLFIKHPLSFGLILLMQTIFIALITGMMTMNYWFSYIIFLVMIGGMLILFIYMTSIASNEKFKLSMKLIMSSMPIFMMLSIFIIYDLLFFNSMLNNDLINQINNLNFKLSLNKFINFPLNTIFYLMIIYLLITLIMVVKITNIKSGPLRQKN